MRKKHIIEILKVNKFATLEKLSKILNYSVSTIRRDVTELERSHLVKRTHGGVMILDGELTEPIQELKITIEKSRKEIISDLAVDFITDYNTIFLDSSSTSRVLSKKLNEKNYLEIFTTNLLTALNISKNRNNKVYLIGGELRDGSTTGTLAAENVKNFYFDLAFISSRGFDINYGGSERLSEEVSYKRALREQTEKLIMLVDNTKFELKFPFKNIDIKEIDVLITDKKPSQEIIDNLPSNIDLSYL